MFSSFAVISILISNFFQPNFDYTPVAIWFWMITDIISKMADKEI